MNLVIWNVSDTFKYVPVSFEFTELWVGHISM